MADAFVLVVDLGGAVGEGDGDRDDLVPELAALGSGDGALVGLVAKGVEVVLGEAVLPGDHLGAGELAELDVGVAFLHAGGFVGP